MIASNNGDSLGSTRAFSVELGHHHFGVGAEGQRVGVVTVGRDDAVRRADGLHHAGEDGFLADVEVAESAEFLLDVQVTAALLEAAHQQHVAVPLDVGLLGVRRLGLLLGGRFPSCRGLLCRRGGGHVA